MDVVQRIGPLVGSRVAVRPLEAAGPATEHQAALMRRAFRRWIGEIADPDSADDLTLAVYEALANAVDHAYLGADAGTGEMRLWAAASAPLYGGRDVVITVSDDGHWRDQHDPGWRGRGIALVRRLTTTSSVLATATGTTVQMRRRVAPGDPALN